MFGRITHGPTKGSVVDKTLEFVYSQLPIWRDKPHREVQESEEALNGQLCKHLNAAARRENFSMAHFHHEERQGERRRVDLSAQPIDETIIAGRAYQDDQPFLVFECKRLPADRKSREREYVTGDDSNGGIQRFKLGLHGANLSRAAMIAYVQKSTCSEWLNKINDWIKELGELSKANWAENERLIVCEACVTKRSLRSVSNHSRVRSSEANIELTHLWVEM
jgi:hypothetical protein